MRLALLAAAATIAATTYIAPAFSQTPSESAAIEEFKRGQASANAKKNDETITIMTAVINEGKLPKEWQPYPYFYRGQAYRRLEKFTDALGDFDKATALKADLAPAFFEGGLAYQAQQKYKQSIGQFDKAIKITPDNAEYVYSRCVSKSWAGDNAGARDDCRRATELKPDYVDAWQTLGRAYEDLGQVEKAEATYKKVLELEPGNKEAREGLDYIATCRKPGADCSGTGGAEPKKKGK
ncbi:MAG: tetratricopeptide repeat protein [Alphaproteobacteria bacterium]|nr:tetratricopeptide repeat protein [Alphaproteobacteria bacterium]